MIALLLLGLMALCAAVPAAMFIINLRRYVSPRFGYVENEYVAVLIPARNEARNIKSCVEAVLASEDVAVEVWVCDDGSSDATTHIVRAMSEADERVHLLHSPR
ncbi:glycosyltransferase family 2 protein [Granulicella cerasi]|uniref:Glycosyltransferase family 2 protein n=1 Tax=Granulicella cerasi TaxID=741063 RepID=A0ABW1ZBZ7_9BACT